MASFKEQVVEHRHQDSLRGVPERTGRKKMTGVPSRRGRGEPEAKESRALCSQLELRLVSSVRMR